MIKNFLSILIALIVSLCSLTGCKGFLPPSETTEPTETQNAQFGHSEAVSDLVEISTYPSQKVTKTEVLTEYDFELSEIPDFSGSPYVVINGNLPYFDESDYSLKSFESYSDLDALNRCGTTFACIGRDIMPTEERGEIGQVKPTGWHTVKYDCVDGKYLYNRCHLIGYQLTGENANTKNLITGTRYMNVDGMLPFENMVADYVEETNNHVMYRVTPIYDGDNLLANGVLMEAYSVEDNGEGICFNVFCYNAQPGVIINYKTGDSYLANTSTETTENSIKNSSEKEYILNTNSKKIHLPDCSSVDDMAEKNKQKYYGTIEDLISDGYSTCGYCKP